MAYMSQEKKASLAPAIKKACTKYGVRATISVRSHRTLCVSIKSGRIDFIGNFNRVNGARSRPDHLPFQPATNHLSVNPYWYHEHFDGEALNFLKELISAMNQGNHDRSDIQSDYFDVGWYIDVDVGRWDKPYILEK